MTKAFKVNRIEIRKQRTANRCLAIWRGDEYILNLFYLGHEPNFNYIDVFDYFSCKKEEVINPPYFAFDKVNQMINHCLAKDIL